MLTPNKYYFIDMLKIRTEHQMVFKKKSEIYSSKTVKHILKYFSRPVHFYMINYFLKLSRRLSACWIWAIKILYAKSERG